MEHNLGLVQEHDRILTLLQEQMQQIRLAVEDVKTMIRGLNVEHRDDGKMLYDLISTHKEWTRTEIQRMSLEVAVLKTKIIMIGTISATVVSVGTALLMKYI